MVYSEPVGAALDFPGEDSKDEEDLPGKGSGATPTISKTVGGTAQDDANEEDDERFITVGDNEEAPVDQVLVSIPVGQVSKPGGSGLDGKDRMFESDNEDDAEVLEQIETVLAKSGPLDDLQLSESEDDSESDTPDDNDDGGDPNETKQYYQGQEDETAKDSGLNPTVLLPLWLRTHLRCRVIPENRMIPIPVSGKGKPANQAHTFQGQGPQQWEFQQSPCLQVQRHHSSFGCGPRIPGMCAVNPPRGRRLNPGHGHRRR